MPKISRLSIPAFLSANALRARYANSYQLSANALRARYANSYQPSTISYQPLAISYQPSAISHQLSADGLAHRLEACATVLELLLNKIS
ncbi:MAG: hypothetical protein F6K26_41850 [Moorea sp. SIO2I5]|nr:hypothetical protein [Moorena sp. SIO2I5]